MLMPLFLQQRLCRFLQQQQHPSPLPRPRALPVPPAPTPLSRLLARNEKIWRVQVCTHACSRRGRAGAFWSRRAFSECRSRRSGGIGSSGSECRRACRSSKTHQRSSRMRYSNTFSSVHVGFSSTSKQLARLLWRGGGFQARKGENRSCG